MWEWSRQSIETAEEEPTQHFELKKKIPAQKVLEKSTESS